VLLFLFISSFNVTIEFSNPVYPVFSVVLDSFVGPIDFTFHCGFCVLIGLFVALNLGMSRNPNHNQMFIFSVDLVHHFHNLGLCQFIISFRAVRQLSVSLIITLFDSSEVLVILMAVFIDSTSAFNIENRICNRISLISVG
jgi:hypothetical protein